MTEQRPDDYVEPHTPAEAASDQGASAAQGPVGGPAPAASRRGLKVGIAGLAALALLGGGVAVADPFGWRDESSKLTLADIVPASANAIGEANLDPGLTQQAEMVRFALKFPSARSGFHVTEQGDVKKELWQAVTKDEPCTAVDYDTDVKPWLGDQFAAALLDSTKDTLVVAKASDEAKARAGMAKMATCWHWKDAGVAWRDGYVVAAPSQSAADRAVADGRTNPLSKRAEFTEDFGRVGTQGVASFWATREGLQDLAASNTAQGERTALPSSVPSAGTLADHDVRSVAGTLRFVDGNPEVRVAAKSNKTLKTSTSHTEIDRFPPETTLAVGVSDGAQLVSDNWALVQKALQQQGTSVSDLERKANLKLPDDLETLLGKDLRLGVGRIPAGASGAAQLPIAVVSKSDKGKLQELLDRTQVSASGVTLTDGRDDTVVGAVDTTWARTVAAKQVKALADQDVFTAAYPTAEQAQFGLYVNLDAYKDQITKGLTTEQKADVEPLQAVGISSHVEDANYGVMVARLTAR